MKTLITTLSLVATITLANAERTEANLQPVVEVSDITLMQKSMHFGHTLRNAALKSVQSTARKEKFVAADKPRHTANIFARCLQASAKNNYSRILVCREDG